jgi:hypothetical protein
LVWKVFGPSAKDAGHFLKRRGKDGRGRPVSATSIRFATRKYADAVMRASIGSGSADLIEAEDFLLDIHRGAVHIWGRERNK